MSNRIRYWEIWETLKTRLNSARMQAVLQGGKVYIEGQNYSAPEKSEALPWGRLVIVPSQTLWPDESGVGPTRSVPFLTRAEFNTIPDPGFNVQKSLDAIQDECAVLLEGYILPVMAYAQAATPVWLSRPPQPLPLWDDTRGLYLTSAEWRTEVASKQV